MKLSFQRGFSLIELMVVVAIIGILAMFAIPSYQDYALRARFAEVVSATEPFKTAIAVALQKGEPAAQLKMGKYGIPAAPTATKNLAALTVENAVITATATEAAGGVTFILKPNKDGSKWTVEGTCLTKGLCEQ